jgi:hypothetical protein
MVAVSLAIWLLLLQPGAPPRPLTPVEEAAVRQILESDERDYRVRLRAWGGLTPAAFPLYARVLDDPMEDPGMVNAVLNILALPDVTADKAGFVDRAVAHLAHKDVGVRRAAVNLLSRIGSSRDVAPVVALLTDPDVTVPYAAARTLAAIGDRRAFTAIDVWLGTGSHHDHPELLDHVRRCREELRVRLDRATPPARQR